jgi:hypothetical protein
MIIAIAIELMGRLPEWEKQERLNFAAEILQVCEIEGMVPPDYYTEYYTENGYSYNRGFVNKGWEPEDEEK